MSGPKISWYEMSETQKRNFDVQSKCDREIVACASSIRKILSDISINTEQFSKTDGLGSESVIAEATKLKGEFEQAKSEKKSIQTAFTEFDSYTIPPKVLLADSEVTRKQEILRRVQALKKRAIALSDNTDTLQGRYDALTDKLKADIEKSLESSLDLDWNLGFDDEPEQDSKADLAEVKESIIKELNRLLKLKLSPKLSEKVKKTIDATEDIDSSEYIKNFRAISVTPLSKECARYDNLKREKGEYYDSLIADYEVLCNQLHIGRKSFEFSEDGITALEAEIAVLEYEYAKSKEEEYIADAIDEVMEEMGYSLVGRRTVAKKNGKRFRDELYSFGEGTCVNIRFDDNGQIAMELGGVDTEDRAPTDDEAAKLENDMISFCDKHSEFEKRLSQKGIILKNRVKHFPAKAEFAQIINTSDYEMTGAVETITTARKTATNKKQYRSE